MGALIWLASYPKSGNTWMRSFLHNLLRGGSTPVDINRMADFCLGESDASWYAPRAPKTVGDLTPEELAAIRPIVHQDFTTAFPDSVFVKTHNFLGESFGYPIHNMDVTAGAIYIVRNPLDITLSAANHFGLTTDEAIDFMSDPDAMTGGNDRHVFEYLSSWSFHVQSWTQNPNPQLLVVRYEDLIRKPRKHFKQVAGFLGLKPPAERLERAIKFSSFKVLKAQEEKSGFQEKSKASDKFFREGKAEQWKEKLTPKQIRRVIDNHREQMERFDYVPKDYA
ncbi:sulfotransferase domain-containing protein [Parvibaculum sp. MBR-TMA-1.3b-4.2]